MLKSIVSSLVLLSIGITAGVIASKWPSLSNAISTEPIKTVTNDDTSTGPEWVAAAPGRVEPISGEIRIAASAPGRIDGIYVHPHDKVVKHELLANIDDSEQRARVRAAEAEVAFREAERETAVSGAVPNVRRVAEDRVANVEEAKRRAQAKLDQLAAGGSLPLAMDSARTELFSGEIQFKDAQHKLDVLLTTSDVPKLTRTESALAVARAELAIAVAALEKTRIRAPLDGTVLQVLKLTGDTATAASDDVVVSMGDTDRLRVRAEIDENEIGSLTIGQTVVIRSDAFPNKSFTGSISLIGAAARPRILTPPSAMTKDNALEVIVDLDAAAELVPGTRVDAFFEPNTIADRKGDKYGSN